MPTSISHLFQPPCHSSTFRLCIPDFFLGQCAPGPAPLMPFPSCSLLLMPAGPCVLSSRPLLFPMHHGLLYPACFLCPLPAPIYALCLPPSCCTPPCCIPRFSYRLCLTARRHSAATVLPAPPLAFPICRCLAWLQSFAAAGQRLLTPPACCNNHAFPKVCMMWPLCS